MMPSLSTVQVGQTSLRVTIMGLGTGPLSGLYRSISQEQASEMVVLQKKKKQTTMSKEVLSLFSLCCSSKQLGNQCSLACYISLLHSLYLPFAYHVHDLIAL